MIVSFSGEIIKERLRLGVKALFVISILLFIDQLCKYLVTQYIIPIEHVYYTYPYGGIGVFQNFYGIEFSINYMTNKGAAWGVLGAYQLPLVIFRIFLIAGAFTYLLFYNNKPSWKFPLFLIIGGAIGNVVDFFVYGHVIDMFHFVLWGYDFPVFNVADSAITVGIIWLFILSWTDP